METILIVLGVVLLVIIAVAIGKSRWHTLEIARGQHADDLQTKYAYLQMKHIPCRLKAEAAANGQAGFAAGTGVGMPLVGSEHQNELLKLQVRPKDRSAAETALKELQMQQLTSHGSPL